jgi:uncharacterized protein YbbC (DUF1343 family)/CubicO group peptidase (beta-lactamase class C family)
MRRVLLLLLFAFALDVRAADVLPEVEPESVGFIPGRLGRLDVFVQESIAKKEVPGAVVLVGHSGKIVYAKAFGDRALVPARERMTRDTLFDMASLTKPVATATSIMILIERGKLTLTDTLERLLPEFDNHSKGTITLEQLLRHRSGLVADNPIGDYDNGVNVAWNKIANLGITYQPGDSYVYSDVNFLVLGRIVERYSGKSLDVFAEENIFKPLGMKSTGFAVNDRFKPDQDRIAPTEPDHEKMLRGTVHDPRARALGGVAGHAGLFSTADDMAIFAQTMLNEGEAPNGHRLLKPETVRAMVDAGATPIRQRRGLGWDVDTPHSGPRGAGFRKDGFGHTGFTGTSLWIDRPSRTFVIVLTSRLHPDGKGKAPLALRHTVATIVAAALADRPDPGALCGVDVLARSGFAPLKGKRIGLVTNHTGLLRDGTPTIDALHKAPDVKLVALFSPEHGIRGAVDAEVSDSRDEATGLPVYSLYNKTRKPTPEMLKDVDALVYDIQDIGARFYTYISTLGLVMEAAKDKGIPLFVLDRPNPIGGEKIAGPVRDSGFESFIAFHALPVRHGLTIGELARMFNAERKIGADLTVIPCENWRRGDLFDRTGLRWVNPSPNMRSLTEALLYPGVGLLEGTNLATGRGTDTPFERVGAPYIEPRAFAAALNALELPGVRFIPLKFTPKERQFAGKECGGVYIEITERESFEPVALGIGMACVLRSLHPDEWKPEALAKFLCDDAAFRAIVDGKPAREVEAIWAEELARFEQSRRPFLIYR